MNDEKMQPTKEAKKQIRYLIIVPLVTIILFGMFAGGAFWASKKMRDASLEGNGSHSETADQTDSLSDEALIDEAVNDEDIEIDVSTGEHAVNINWISLEQQTQQEMNPILHEIIYGEERTATEPFSNEEYVINDADFLNPVAYKIGTVNSGAYEGYILTHEIAEQAGMGMYYQHFYLLTDPEGKAPPIILDRYSNSISEVFTHASLNESARNILEYALNRVGNKLRFDAGAIVAEFENADLVRDTQGREYLLSGVWQRVDYPTEFDYLVHPLNSKLENGRSLRQIVNSDLTNFDYQFFTIRKDGRLMFYDASIVFWRDGNDLFGTPAITWSNGSYNQAEYMKGAIGGCGFSSSINVIDRSEIGELQEIGYYTKNSLRNSVYGPVDYGDNRYQLDFENWHRLDETRTLADFEAMRPYFYWQDAFGRWIEFRNIEVAPVAECGKPVIYLYPEKTMDITVTLEPQGGFSVTEPVYNDGWTVTASPNGQLVSHSDGKVYSYLFWEGWGALYIEPAKYWVVAQADVHDFLIETLAELGLNEQETADFMEFWYPRMQNAPWYKIGFHGTEVMDIIAPMELSAEPDMVLRILMDYTELAEPIAENPPLLPPTPIRYGFSVIEWGGVLR